LDFRKAAAKAVFLFGAAHVRYRPKAGIGLAWHPTPSRVLVRVGTMPCPEPRGGAMRRREVITLLGASTAFWPFVARAQQATKLRTIGFLGPNTAALDGPRVSALVQRLHELGWIEGRTIAIEYRWAE